MRTQLSNIVSFVLLALLQSGCATDPGASTPVGGASIFTYEKGNFAVIVKAPASRFAHTVPIENLFSGDFGVRNRSTFLVALALTDVDTVTSTRRAATGFASGVTAAFPSDTTLSWAGCSGTPSLQSTQLDAKGLYKLYTYTYPEGCQIPSGGIIATATVSKTKESVGSLNITNRGASTPYYTIFTSSVNIPVSPALDDACNTLGVNGVVTAAYAGRWKAIYSTATTDARDHVVLNSGYQVLNAQGTLVENSAADLWLRSVHPSREYDENGTYQPGLWMWTGSNNDGTKTIYTCNSWTSVSASDYGTYGFNDGATEWLSVTVNAGCNTGAGRFYCINSD